MKPARLQILTMRSRVLQAIRSFFTQRGFIEVETPVRIPTPALELHIDAEPAGGCFLRTSPELHMKRMLVDGFDRIFQLAPCFRAGEQGPLHSPEFTMLEWYHAGATYMDTLDECQELIRSIACDVCEDMAFEYQGVRIDLAAEWDRMTVSEAFRRSAGWDPVEFFDADRFDLDLVGKVEPAMSKERPVILHDYPVEQAALAQIRTSEGRKIAQRWELYVAGIELANAFGELTDANEQRNRFEQCAAERRALGKQVYPLDESFLSALGKGLPQCSGVALGVDRLVMLLADRPSIADVQAFPAAS